MTRIAYVMSRFPRITETFVLYEMLELEKLGLRVDVFPLLRQRAAVVHPEAQKLVETACHQPLLSLAVVAANLHYLLRRPRAYLAALARALGATWGSANFFLGALCFFPKSAWMAREMERRGVEHVHAHFANHPALAAFIIHRLTGIPYSFTAHGSDIHVDQRSLGLKIAESAFAVTVSEYNKAFLVDRVGPQVTAKLHVIHCGIDPGTFPAAPPPRDGRDLRILCVASLRAVKGHQHLVEACRLLRQRGVNFRCDLVGDGPLRREVRRQIESAGLQGAVIMHGDLARPAVLEMLRGADVAVLASALDRQGRREGIPVSLMEAMAAGCAVVASDLSGIPELVTHGTSGILVPPGDAGAIASALADLAASPQARHRLGRAARAAVLARFNLAASASRLGELVCRAAHGGAAIPGSFSPGPNPV